MVLCYSKLSGLRHHPVLRILQQTNQDVSRVPFLDDLTLPPLSTPRQDLRPLLIASTCSSSPGSDPGCNRAQKSLSALEQPSANNRRRQWTTSQPSELLGETGLKSLVLSPRGASPVALTVKNLPDNARDLRGWVQPLGREDPLEKGMVAHSHSCLENPMGREAWQATVHRAAENWT